MKGILLALVCSLMSVMLYGQGFVVAAEKMNVAYIGLDNPLTIVAEGYSCSQLVATCDNGTLTKSEGCHYKFRPDKQGAYDVIISAKTKTGIKQIGSVKYRVKFVPSPVATIAGKSRGVLSASVFKAQLGIGISYEQFEFDIHFAVRSFKIEIFRGSEVLYSEFNSGSQFNEIIRGQIKSLKPGDRIAVTGIKAASPDSRILSLNDINLVLN